MAAVQAPAFRVPKQIATDIRTVTLLSGVTESELLGAIVIRAIRRRIRARLKGQTVAPRASFVSSTVAQAGGWRNAAILQTIYQQPDDATLYAVVSQPAELREMKGS